MFSGCPSIGYRYSLDILRCAQYVFRCSQIISDDHRYSWIFSRCSLVVLCSQDVSKRFSGCSQDFSMRFSGCSDGSCGLGGPGGYRGLGGPGGSRWPGEWWAWLVSWVWCVL